MPWRRLHVNPRDPLRPCRNVDENDFWFTPVPSRERHSLGVGQSRSVYGPVGVQRRRLAPQLFAADTYCLEMICHVDPSQFSSFMQNAASPPPP
jgi:hypothetical protein